MKRKKLSYAYASSPHADAYNHGRACYILDILAGPEHAATRVLISRIIIEDQAEAIDRFRALDIPASWDSFTEEHFARWAEPRPGAQFVDNRWRVDRCAN